MIIKSKVIVNKRYCEVATIKCPKSYSFPKLRLDVNSYKDYLFVKEIYENLYKKNKFFNIRDTIKYLKKEKICMKIILIGSSPAMMLQALVLSRKYNDIEIHEKTKEVGGSWKTSNFYNLKSVETGTHILAPWKNNRIFKESLSILKKKIGLRLFFLKPPPERLINKNISKKEIKKIKYFYVKGGAKKIIENIKSLLKKKKNKNSL